MIPIVKDSQTRLLVLMKSDLVRIHHADYQEDIPFWIQSLTGLDPVLEIGCGHGRVTLPLIEAGHIVVGLDHDSEPLSYLKKEVNKLSEESRSRTSLIQVDILDFESSDEFGGVIIPCNTYSTFEADARVQLLAVVHSLLEEGGSVIASLPNPRIMQEIYEEVQGSDSQEAPDPERVISHPETGFPVQVSSRLRAGRNCLLWDWIYDHLRPDGEVERSVVTVGHYPATTEQLLGELDQTGFGNVLCLGGYEGVPYVADSPYLILVCRK